MKELIDEHQVHLLMLGLLLVAPLAGLAWGARTKQVGPGLVLGLLVGAGNYALWTAYNAITEKLGLDTVKNLLVNLGLFVVLGIVVGLAAGVYGARKRNWRDVQGGKHGDVERHRAG